MAPQQPHPHQQQQPPFPTYPGNCYGATATQRPNAHAFMLPHGGGVSNIAGGAYSGQSVGAARMPGMVGACAVAEGQSPYMAQPVPAGMQQVLAAGPSGITGEAAATIGGKGVMQWPAGAAPPTACYGMGVVPGSAAAGYVHPQ